jgi:hypothetical protein
MVRMRRRGPDQPVADPAYRIHAPGLITRNAAPLRRKSSTVHNSCRPHGPRSQETRRHASSRRTPPRAVGAPLMMLARPASDHQGRKDPGWAAGAPTHRRRNYCMVLQILPMRWPLFEFGAIVLAIYCMVGPRPDCVRGCENKNTPSPVSEVNDVQHQNLLN